MNNTQKTWAAVAAVIVILLIIGGFYFYKQNGLDKGGEVGVEQDGIQGNEFASKCGLIVENITVDAKVSFPLTIKGTIDNAGSDVIGCTWTMSEGQAGKAELFYQTKDGWSLPVDSEVITVENWMSTTTPFAVTLNFDNSKENLPSDYTFKVVFTEENPSGEGEVDTLELPIMLK